MFDDLDFAAHPSAGLGYTSRAKLFFGNGYGASVITGLSTYSSDSAPYELAVLVGTEDDWYISYDTPITDDVLGYLTEAEVSSTLEQIKALAVATKLLGPDNDGR